METEGGGVFLDRGTFLVGVVVEGDFHSEAILLTALGRWPGLVEEVTGVLGSGAFATGTAGVVVVVEAPGLSWGGGGGLVEDLAACVGRLSAKLSNTT